MIRIDRSSVPSPPSLAVAGSEERERAIAFYREPANAQESFPYAAYKAKDVLAALEELFQGKCAYCESSYRATSPADIEHFRPKGAVLIEDGSARPVRRKPGYYWLAAEWDNLLPSCIDCNRRRTQEFPDDDVTEVSGKENKFPLCDERRRGSKPGDELTLERDQRLLIHPCEDDPEAHLEFRADGVVEARRAGEAPSRMGAATIKVLGLHRSGLIAARRDHLKRLAERMQEMRFFIEALDADPSNATLQRELELRLTRLRETTAADQVYAGMARQFVGAFEAALEDRTYRHFAERLLREVTGRAGRRPKSTGV